METKELIKLEEFAIIRELKITDLPSKYKAVQWRDKLLAHMEIVDEKLGARVRETNIAHKGACTIFKEAMEEPKELLSMIDKGITNFDQSEARKREEDEARARKALLEVQEQSRDDQALGLMAEGRTEEAAQVLNADLIQPEVHFKSEVKVKGISTIDNWKARVVDASKLPVEYTKRVPDDEKLAKLAKATKGKSKVDGVEFYNAAYISSRRK